MKNYLLNIKLLEIEPSIWRRLVVPGTVSLAKLHSILQKVMGWENYHIYLFEAGREQFGEVSPSGPKLRNESSTRSA